MRYAVFLISGPHLFSEANSQGHNFQGVGSCETILVVTAISAKSNAIFLLRCRSRTAASPKSSENRIHFLLMVGFSMSCNVTEALTQHTYLATKTASRNAARLDPVCTKTSKTPAEFEPVNGRRIQTRPANLTLRKLKLSSAAWPTREAKQPKRIEAPGHG